MREDMANMDSVLKDAVGRQTSMAKVLEEVVVKQTKVIESQAKVMESQANIQAMLDELLGRQGMLMARNM